MVHRTEQSYDSGHIAPPPFTTGFTSMNLAAVCEVESLGESENLSCGVPIGKLIFEIHECSHWLTFLCLLLLVMVVPKLCKFGS